MTVLFSTAGWLIFDYFLFWQLAYLLLKLKNIVDTLKKY